MKYLYDVDRREEVNLPICLSLGDFLRVDFHSIPDFSVLPPKDDAGRAAWYRRLQETKEALGAEMAIVRHQVATEQLRVGLKRYADIIETGGLPTFTEEELKDVAEILQATGAVKFFEEWQATLEAEAKK